MAISTRKDVHKKYVVGGYGGSRFAKTDTLAEAKQAGAAIARKEAWRGKWNAMFIPVSIDRQVEPGSIFYKSTGWTMYIPVRGSGATADRITAEIKRRHGVAPFKWTRK
ncbi:hypothetical protein LCGC14_0539780 [marine sediment metagenome]|uniref:Uncharacterized protein n=1 Tax=marine sediment metagenome TaxID=412755 RepID=A0A0F9UEI0_9ZZZZ